MADLPDVTSASHSGGYMGITTPSQDRAPAWLPTAEIPVQRQAPPVEVGLAVPPQAPPAPAVPRPRQPRPVATYVIAAGLAAGMVGGIGAVQAATTDTAPPASGVRRLRRQRLRARQGPDVVRRRHLAGRRRRRARHLHD